MRLSRRLRLRPPPPQPQLAAARPLVLSQIFACNSAKRMPVAAGRL